MIKRRALVPVRLTGAKIQSSGEETGYALLLRVTMLRNLLLVLAQQFAGDFPGG